MVSQNIIAHDDVMAKDVLITAYTCQQAVAAVRDLCYYTAISATYRTTGERETDLGN